MKSPHRSRCVCVCVHVLQQKVKTEVYGSLSSFLADVQLMLDNTRLFFDPLSSEYQQATALEATFTLTLKEYGFAAESDSDSDSVRSPTELTLRIPKSHLHPSSSTSTTTTTPSDSTLASSIHKLPNLKITLPSLKLERKAIVVKDDPSISKLTDTPAWISDYVVSNDPVRMFIAAVYNYHEPATGDFTAEPFHQLPSRTQYPEYYRVILQPIDLLSMHNNAEVC